LKVLVLSPDFPPAKGGIQLLVHRLTSNLQAANTHVVTVTPGATGMGTRVVRGVWRTRAPRAAAHLTALASLNATAVLEAVRSRPDIVMNAHIVTSPAGVLISQALRSPLVQYLYGEEVARRPGLARFAGQHAQAVIVVSRHTAQLARICGIPSDRVYVIPPGVDIPDSVSAERDGRPSIVTVARLTERYKGHDVMIRALPLVRARVPNVRWVIIGDGPLRISLECHVHALGLAPHVHFTGEVEDEERNAWLRRCHLLAMPSRSSPRGGGEGFGIVYLEAGAHELPVVAGDGGGARDAVLDGETGLLVDPRDHLAVAEAISTLLSDGERSRAMGRAAARRAQCFAWPRIARQVHDLLTMVVARRL
jgi:phosphatidylinositol alpha-1,6-mannosyltransferase